VERARCIMRTLSGVKVHFLSDDFRTLLRKAKYQHKFDVMFFGTSGLPLLSESRRPSVGEAGPEPNPSAANPRPNADPSPNPKPNDDLRYLGRPGSAVVFENGRNLVELNPKQVSPRLK